MMNVFISLQRHLVCRSNLLITASNTALEVTQPVPVYDPTQFLSLNCFVLGDDLKRVFIVEVEKTKKVGILKTLIKKENSSSFRNVDSKNIDLWNVSIPKDDDADERLKSIYNLEPLDALLRLSDVFPHVEEYHLHVIVQSPIDGELSEIF